MSTSGLPLLVMVDPAAKEADGESVRIARDVLCAGTPDAKVCLPDGPRDAARALRHGVATRRPVVVGDDRALLSVVQLLYGQRALGAAALSVVPVGEAPRVRLARGLGIPADAVTAARAALGGAERRFDLLVDDCGQVVLGGVRLAGATSVGGLPEGEPVWRRVCRSLAGSTRGERTALRVEADGRLLADWDRPVREVSLTADGRGGFARVAVRGSDPELWVLARHVSVAGPEFRYRAGGTDRGAVRGSRSWTVAPDALRVMVPG